MIYCALIHRCRNGGMADTTDLKSVADQRRRGSSPLSGTIYFSPLSPLTHIPIYQPPLGEASPLLSSLQICVYHFSLELHSLLNLSYKALQFIF